MYGGRVFEFGGSRIMERQALHAGLLAFDHPATQEPMVFTAPPPDDFVHLVRTLRSGRVRPVHNEGCVPLARFGLGAD
jgi:hypothetical protein